MDSQGIGNGHLLPAGPLREPWPRKTDLLIHTQFRTMAEGYESIRQLSPWAISKTSQKISLSELTSKPIEVVSGIAKPQAFADMLLESGFQIQHRSDLPDHDDFSNWQASYPELPLLCTEKDAVKLWQTHPNALAVPLIFEPENAFWEKFDALMQ
jgi:tetraacyldisaccharide 4'-kinase